MIVMAAASCTEVVEASQTSFAEGPLQTQFASTQTLVRQILDGAPADVFLSASTRWKDALVEARRVEGAPQVFARGRLVCIAKADDPAAGAPHDLADIGSLLAASDRIALADEGVPAGTYAREALRHAGLWDGLRGRVVGLPDVRHVLRAVDSGEIRLGFVYRTDAALSGVAILCEVDASLHDPIEYWACVLASAPQPDRARAYVQFLVSGEGRSILERYGFE
ncbi:MAG: molybdate ABC transporter substrate-binding protein [Planctomycetes bacterium]|nr:molybdate ABC transporter substrate-binding protein [Planctomycetota bacterium]